MKQFIPESIGKRVARLRQQKGYTQQTLADRLAISRVAVSHIEADLSIPSERTITLLAGLFKCSPDEIVENTTYPPAKADRLPSVVAWYTPLEFELGLFENDLDMVQALHQDKRIAYFVLGKWKTRLANYAQITTDILQKELLAKAWEKLKKLENR